MAEQQPNHTYTLPTGYGPSTTNRPPNNPRPAVINRPASFDGDERHFEIWSLKFTSYLQIRGLIPISEGETDQFTTDPMSNSEIFAELIQALDDKSISLIMRDARNDGMKALCILKHHYQPKGKARVITLYTELTSLSKTNESVTDYIIRAETLAAALRDTGETISDGLLIAMVLKGLPIEFKAFTIIINQMGDMSFSDFKVALRNFEDNDSLNRQNPDSVMKFKVQPIKQRFNQPHFTKNDTNQHDQSKQPKSRWCTKCKMSSHDTKFCKRYCDFHKTDTHWTSQCRQRNARFSTSKDNAKMMEYQQDNHYIFKTRLTYPLNNPLNTTTTTLLVDSGATTHIVNDETKFSNLDKSFDPNSHIIELADGSRLTNIVQGRGDATILLEDSDGNIQEATLHNALFIPSFKQNIFSVQAATQNGCKINFSNNYGFLEIKGITFNISKYRNMYFINATSPTIYSRRNLSEWHRTLGHCNFEDIIKLESSVEGMKIINPKDREPCETCILGKLTETRSRAPDEKSTEPFAMVHCDLAGPIDPVSHDGHKFALICVDDYSGLSNIYLLKRKSDTGLAFNRFISEIAPFGKVKSVRTDFGGEFESSEFENVCLKNNIRHERSSPYSPHQNGTAERQWRILFDMSRCLLLDSKLPKHLWPYALMCSSYIRNRCFNNRLAKTPFEAITGKKPNLSKMFTFGQKCFTLLQNQKKLDARAKEGIFVGYDKLSPAYLIYFPNDGTIKRVRCVKFSIPEKHISQNKSHDTLETQTKNNDSDDGTILLENCIPIPGTDNDNSFNENTYTPPTPESDNNSDNRPETQIDNTDSDIDNESNLRKRQTRRPKHLDDFYVHDEIDEHLNFAHIHYCFNVHNEQLPLTYNDATTSENSKYWIQAMNDEMCALRENETFDLVQLPENRTAIGSRWVYTTKNGPNGETKYKARFVAKGFSQIPGIDYDETFSPTARMTSVRIMTQFAVQNELAIHQLDVKSAYLNAPIDCDLYIEQPEGYATEGDPNYNENLVWKLKKSLYGLKQSGRNWHNLLHGFLIELGFDQSQVDPCVYTMYSEKGITLMLCYVDDILLTSNSESMIFNIKDNLNQRFKMTDLGKVKNFLGIEFNHDKETITMHQTTYLSKLLCRFGMQDCKPKYTPCESNVNKFENESAEEIDPRMYREIVGGLIYAMTCTRPDLSFIVTKLSQHMSKPNARHMTMAKHTLRYIKATIDRKLIFRRSENPLRLTGFCDSDWASSEDRKSISGYAFALTKEGPLISWKTKKQSTVALSTCEAEYVALSSATQEGMFLLELLNDIPSVNLPDLDLNCDNQSAISLAKNPVLSQRTKHIDIKYHFVRNFVQSGKMHILYVQSECNIADALTKPMTRVKNERFQLFAMG